MYEARYWWKFGRPADVWIKNIDFIKQFVAENHLQALTAGGLAVRSGETEHALETPMALRRPGFPNGGIRVPHLHFEGEIYLVNEEQWRSFTGQIMKGFRQKLAGAKAVSLEQMVELSEAIDSLA